MPAISCCSPIRTACGWDRAEIDEGLVLIRRGAGGPYAFEAAIAAVHAMAWRAEETDWRRIVDLYDRLFALHPSPVVALNRAVAIAMADGAEAALPLVDVLAEPLANFHL